MAKCHNNKRPIKTIYNNCIDYYLANVTSRLTPVFWLSRINYSCVCSAMVGAFTRYSCRVSCIARPPMASRDRTQVLERCIKRCPLPRTQPRERHKKVCHQKLRNCVVFNACRCYVFVCRLARADVVLTTYNIVSKEVGGWSWLRGALMSNVQGGF